MARQDPKPAAGGVLVRPAALADIEAMLQMWAGMVHEHAELDPRFQLAPDALEFQRPRLLLALRGEEWVAFVAERTAERELVGFVTGKTDAYPPTVVPRRFGLVGDLYVAPEWRRQGLGGALFGRLADWFQQQGIVELELNVLVRNAPAMRFWERWGFREVLARMVQRPEAG